MKRQIKRLSLAAIALTLVISTAACGGKAKHDPVEIPKDTKEAVQDENYTKDIKEEKEVQEGQVYIQDDMVIATMIIKPEVSDKDAEKLAEEYAESLKATYKDMKVNVQAVKDGKNVANIIKE